MGWFSRTFHKMGNVAHKVGRFTGEVIHVAQKVSNFTNPLMLPENIIKYGRDPKKLLTDANDVENTIHDIRHKLGVLNMPLDLGIAVLFPEALILESALDFSTELINTKGEIDKDALLKMTMGMVEQTILKEEGIPPQEAEEVKNLPWFKKLVRKAMNTEDWVPALKKHIIKTMKKKMIEKGLEKGIDVIASGNSGKAGNTYVGNNAL